MEIRSFRRVFDLERRVYRIDRLRLNPGGLPVRGIVYFLAAVAVALIADRVPVARMLTDWLPWYLRELAMPVLMSVLLSVIRIDGRPFHLAAHALVGCAGGSRRLSRLSLRGELTAPGSRWYPEPLLMLPDGSDSRLRPFSYNGPGAVHVSAPHERHLARRRVTGVGRRLVLVVGRPSGRAEGARSGAHRAAAPVVIVLEETGCLRVA